MTEKRRETDFGVLLSEVSRKLDILLGPRNKSPRETGEKEEEKPKLDQTRLLQIPDHLRKSLLVVYESGPSDSITVASKTGRTRALESAYLNQLTLLGYLTKKRVRRKILFEPNGSEIAGSQLDESPPISQPQPIIQPKWRFERK